MRVGLSEHGAGGSKLSSRGEERDPFREVPLRYLGYANEVGEAFRHVVAVRWVYLSYLVSSGYVAAHSLQQGYRARRHNGDGQAHVYKTNPSAAVVDTLLWQGLASVAIPGVTINRICALSRSLLSQRSVRRLVASPSVRKWTVTAIGLGSIPFIIGPIDRFVDLGMDFFSRPLLRKMFP